MKILKYPIIALFAFFNITISMAFGASTMPYDLTLSVGNLCEYVGKIQTDDSGSKNVCSFNPYVASSVDFSLTNQWILSPEAGFSVPQSGRDKNISKMSLFLLANAKYRFSDFHFLAGAGLFFTRIAGAGGSQSLNNGNSTVSFPMPESTVYTRNFILNLGLGADFNKEWSADLHTYVFNAATAEDRAFSVAINATYHFGEFQ